jgi:hypothetical protein
MQFCLAEACRSFVRLRLKRAKCIVLHQDARGRRLLTRFVAATANLRVLKGTLPCPKRHKSTSQGICAATEYSLTALCTPFLGAPPSSRELSRFPGPLSP